MIKVPSNEECMLETGRLSLHPMTESDAGELFNLLNERSLYAFTSGSPPTSTSQLRERLRQWQTRLSPSQDELWLNWAVRLKRTGTLVGHVQSSVREHRAEIAWIEGHPFQSRGYASVAANRMVIWLRDHLGLGELQANIHPDNLPSQAVARHLGLHCTAETTNESEQVWFLRVTKE